MSHHERQPCRSTRLNHSSSCVATEDFFNSIGPLADLDETTPAPNGGNPPSFPRVDHPSILTHHPIMLAARVRLAALIAIGMALLPIASSAGQSSAPVVSLAMHASENMPCCPPAHSPSTPGLCAVQCGGIIVNEAPVVSRRPVHVVRAVATARHSQPLVGQIVRPPTHPPRA